VDPVLIAYGVGILGVLGLSSIPLYRAYRMHRAASEPIEDGVCVACQSRDCTLLAPAVYRCNKCGFEAGSGMPAYRKALALAQIDAMDPKARFESALADLRESRLALLGAQGLLDNAGVMSAMDIVDLENLDRGSAKQSVVVAAAREMQRAGNCIEQASAKLRQQLTEGPVKAELGSLEMLLDSSLFGDSLATDLLAHARIDALKAETQRVRAQVEHAVRRLEARA